MMPVIQLLDTVWRSWNGIPDANQILALEILNELVNDLAESSRDFVSEMRNGQVLYEDAMQQLHAAEWDVDDDDDEGPDNLKGWLDDNLGVHYTINEDLDIVGVVICVDWGGPNIYVDTLQRVVRGYWGLDEHSVPLSEDICESIDDWAQDRMERAIASR